MKKLKTKKIILFIIIFLVCGILAYTTYRILNDKSKFSIEEKEWLTENINVVQNVNILNNVDVFGKNGKGVFYDFINSFSEDNKININLITYNNGEEVPSNTFKVSYELNDEDILFFQEHYVLISKNKVNMTSISDFVNHKIGIINEDQTVLTNYFKNNIEVALTSYESSANLFEALNNGEEVEYAIIPLEENLTSILTSNYYIDFHLSDIVKYFVYSGDMDEIFNSILKKYFVKWEKDNLINSYDKNELSTFISALSISDKELSNIQAKTYRYGFVNNSPYEILTGGNYGGIINEYLSRFSSFSQTDFNSTRYKNFSKLTEAIAGKKIDLFFNYYDISTDYQKVDSLINISFSIIAPEENNIIINSLSSLKGEEVYIQKNTILENYLISLGGINVKSYSTTKELKKLIYKNKLIIMDTENYNYYSNSLLKNYNVRYQNTINQNYNFYTQNNDTFYILLNKYIQTLDVNQMRVEGLFNHKETIKTGTVLGKIAKYSLLIIAIFVVLLYFIYRSSKKIKITKKIKKEDKMKYIDQLTSLKNRNYLNENIASWNKNKIYPQATIIIDLNQVQTINDTLGYEQGDAQIKAAANILIKTQLDNTDIMRTDGNEYLIYLVGYQERQIVSYIRKLYKEFKNLPYEHGAAIGYSMINDDLKTIEDAINESVEDMRNKKEELEEE